MTDQTNPPAHRSKRRWLRVVLAAVVLAVVAKYVASFVYYRSTAKLLKRNIDAALSLELESTRAEGLPLTFAELDKWYATPPTNENAATVLQEAFALYAKPSPRANRGRQEDEESRTFLLIMGSDKLPPRTEPLPGDMKTSIAKVLAQNEAALKLLHKGAAMTACRSPVDLTQGFAVRLPHLNKFREGANLL